MLNILLILFLRTLHTLFLCVRVSELIKHHREAPLLVSISLLSFFFGVADVFFLFKNKTVLNKDKNTKHSNADLNVDYHGNDQNFDVSKHSDQR